MIWTFETGMETTDRKEKTDPVENESFKDFRGSKMKRWVCKA